MRRKGSPAPLPFQPALPFEKSGAKRRPGAGRPLGSGRAPGHIARPKISGRHPLHVTLRIQDGLPSLKRKETFRCLRFAVLHARKRGLCVNHFSILSNHVHFIVESPDNRRLSKALQALTLSFARRLNHIMNRTGRVFQERYHLHVLKTPREVKNALEYVLLNEAKHEQRRNSGNKISTVIRLDPFSSAWKFGDWKRLGVRPYLESTNWPEDWTEDWLNLALSPAKSWLLTDGWKKQTFHG